MKKLLLVSLVILGTSSHFVEASALSTARCIAIKALKHFPIRAASTLVKIKSFSEIEKKFHPYDRQSGNPNDATLRTLHRIEKQIENDGYLAGSNRTLPLEKLIALVSENFKGFLQSRPAQEKSKYVGTRYADNFIRPLLNL